jgi:hypothetical protein
MRLRSLTIPIVALALVSGCAAEESTSLEQGSNDITVAHGDGVFESGVLTDRLMFTAAPDSFGRQRSQNWCWAASLQTLIRFHGLPVTQEQIVTRSFGGLIDRPASSAFEIAASVNGWMFTDGVRASMIQAVGDDSSPDGLRIRDELENDRPGILALANETGGGGHAFVITSLTYRVVPNGLGGMTIAPMSVKLRDPWPESPSFQVLAWEDVQRRFLGLVYLGIQ